jgi:hypothetical protein
MDKPNDTSLAAARYFRTYGHMYPKYAKVPTPAAVSGLMINALKRADEIKPAETPRPKENK